MPAPVQATFRAIVPGGGITDAKLRCDKGFVHFAFNPRLQYDVNQQYGECGMELLGTPGTRFQLLQF